MAKKNIPKVSFLEFLKHASNILKNPLPFHHNNFEKVGDTFRLIIGPGKSVIFSRDAYLAEYVLQKNQKNYTKSPIQTKDLVKYVGRGLLTAEGDHWKKQRKLIQPAFHKKQLTLLLDSIHNAILTELDKIETDKEIDIFPVFNDLAFQTVVKSLFSSAVGLKDIERLQYITEAAQKMLVRELRQPFLSLWFKYGGEIKKHTDLTDEARVILKKLVQERKESGKREEDLLDMLLDARYEDGNEMDEEQLIDEILILFTAGHETTSNALTFAAQLLARNPESQQLIFNEVQQAKKETHSLMEFIQACNYTKKVVEETMRLYPPAYFIDRINLEDDEFEGVQIPKGSNLLFSFYEIHKHKSHWEDPEKFSPERFSDSDPYLHTPFYAPFGAGPRKCIGNNFAMFEMILAVAEMVGKYEIEEKTTPIEILPLITLKPKNAILNFKKRV
ncbi:cytochrome P450 [Gillisia hiemivivida]|uniref:Cytochrome P450 n=1 Tax=Gillisia hiemivivida TaxID=291190 RepID=A0A5C6ZV00_9FLAO|nr:cytochrome P450 [Gillisia hiemivivida]TXD94688.1 cytochrome P450 [Gillisia hiemivivida]